MNYAEWTFDSNSPIYIQLYKKLQYSILSGQLKPGESVPPIRQMAATLHINANTVVRSYRLISQDGLLLMPRGRKCTVTFDFNLIQGERSREAKAICCNYISSMMALGFSKKELITFLEHRDNKSQFDTK